MPTGKENRIPYVRNSDPDNVNEAVPPYRPSDLGTKSIIDGVQRQKVQLDTGATSATPVGAQAAGMLAYWKDRVAGIVTTDQRFAPQNIQGVAGVFTCAVTPGNQTFIKNGRTRNVSVLGVGTSWVATDQVVSDTLANNTAKGARVAAGTAPTSLLIGYATGPAVAGVVPVDLELPDYD